MRLVMKVEDNNQVISLPVADRMVVGRSGDNSHQPEIDLAPFDSGRMGISRSHAAFTYDGHALFVEDLNSTNGTRINGFRIEPGTPYRLRNGDELEFGRLRLSVRLVRVPA
jgi:pSer/pThr/pTyr-binding forkhead associated (FHA) protein